MTNSHRDTHTKPLLDGACICILVCPSSGVCQHLVCGHICHIFSLSGNPPEADDDHSILAFTLVCVERGVTWKSTSRAFFLTSRPSVTSSEGN